MILITIFAAAIVPRWMNAGSREAEREAADVAALLTIAAEKSSTWGRTVALDGGPDRIALWTLRPDPKAGDDASGAARVRWAPDPLVSPVNLEATRFSRVTADGVAQPTTWRITLPAGAPRPGVELELTPARAGGGAPWVIALTPDAAAATRQGGGATPAPAAPTTIDLDDAGRGTSPW
jgi:hypothetical protein